MVNSDDLVGTAEIADRLGLAFRETVHNWRHRHEDFPQPIAELGCGLIWSWPEVRRWARDTGRLDG